jgi:hypothetical protein
VFVPGAVLYLPAVRDTILSVQRQVRVIRNL